jgi:hypothetical protein
MSFFDILELASPKLILCDFNNLNAKARYPMTLREFAIELPETRSQDGCHSKENSSVHN